MEALPRAARFYISLVLLVGSGLALLAASMLWGQWPDLLACLVLAVVIAVLDLYPVKFPVAGSNGNYTEMTVSTAVKLAAVFIWPFSVAVLGSFLGTLIADWRLKRVWYKSGFNAGVMSFTYFVTGLLYATTSGPVPLASHSLEQVILLLAMGVVQLLINSLLVCLVIALVARISVIYVWVGNLVPTLMPELSMIPIGIITALLYQFSPWSLLLMVIPLIVVRSSYQSVVDLREQTRQALHALARVLDERDEATAHHSEQVAQYAQVIAQAMGLSAAEVDTIVQSAWLHDIGKVGMRDDILYKQSNLTKEERESARQHASIGGDLLQRFPLFSQGSIYVRHHHEWWNGEGYPGRLKGEEIPLGARILSVADAYQAMTDVRPYRRPLSHDAAIGELRRNAGIQFDPRVVQVFIKEMGFEKPELENSEVISDPASVQA